MKLSFHSMRNQVLLASACAATLASCGDPDYPTPKPATSSSVGQARVLVVNAAPGTTGATVSLDNSAFGSSLAYLASAPYTNVTGGQRLFQYTDPTNIPATPTNAPANTPALTASRTVISRSAFVPGTNYTVFITDQPTRAYVYPVTSSSDQGGVRTLTLTDDLTAPAAGKAKVRFVNLSPSLSATSGFGLYNTGTSSFLFSARTYRASTPAFTEVNAGTYTLDVRATPTSTPSIAAQPFTFQDGKIYTLYTRGLTGNAATPLGVSTVLHN